MRIIIIGAGIGGLTTAIALRQRGFTPEIFESASELLAVGKGIWLPTNAMIVLSRLGLAEEVIQRGVSLEQLHVREPMGSPLQTIDLRDVRRRFGFTTVSLLRSTLQEVLTNALPPGCLRLGKQCVGVVPDAEGAVARFADGSEEKADLVIGADGLRSVAREVVAPGTKLRFAGQVCFLGNADYSLPVQERATVNEVWGGRYRFGYSAVTENRVYWFAPSIATHPEVPGSATADELANLQVTYQNFPNPISGLISATPLHELTRVNLHDIAPLTDWFRGRVVLVGDAAHAMTPNLGQGGAQSIEDAYVLAQQLALQAASPNGTSSIANALANYQRIRRPKAARTVRTAWWLGKLAHLEGRAPRSIRNLVLRATPESVNRKQVDHLYSVGY